MSKVQKLKKQKKGMSPEAKATVGNAFKGIISNQSCVDGGKDSPWWVAAIFLCLSIILPLIPIMVTQSKMYGASMLSGYNYGCDEGIYNSMVMAHEAGYDLEVEKGILHFYQVDSTGTKYPAEFEEGTSIGYDILNEEDPSIHTYNFELYITERSGSALTKLIEDISAKKYVKNSLEPYIPDVTPADKELYTPSFMILTPSTMGLALYKQGTTVMATSSYGGLNWNHTKNNEDLIMRILGDSTVEGYDPYKTVLDNTKSILNETFIDQKGIMFRNNTLIYFGVYTGLIVFLGLLVFILTRGKNNSFNYLSFFKCQRITWWASFTPALLGMIFAFLFSGNAIGQMSFVIFLALRIMWMSMRQLRPVQ